MDAKEQFINAYMAAFMGAAGGAGYDMNCMLGKHDWVDHQPVEDALYCAEQAWEQKEKWITENK
jgi:hypothetical protein